jgi:hypothetical protein
MRIVLGIIATFFWCGCGVGTGQEANYVSIENDRISAAEIALLQEGDILLRGGNSLASQQIVQILKEPIPISHCAIFYRTPEGDSVISSESRALQDIDGVQREPLRVFVRDAQPKTLMAVRFKSQTPETAKATVAHAKYYADKKILFDYRFDHLDSSAFYCAEMLQHIYKNVYKQDHFTEVMGQKSPVLRMQQFYDTTKFEILFDHSGILR